MCHITISNERFVVTGVGKYQDRIHINEETSLLVTRIAENALFSNNVLNFCNRFSQCSGKFSRNCTVVSSIVIERSGTLATLLLRKILRWEK